jgi:hypothetical protein
MKEQPVQQPPTREVEVRSSSQEKVYFWWAVIVSVVLVVLFLTQYLQVNAWVLLMAAMLLVIILFVVLRQVPPDDMWDAWKKIRLKEYKESHSLLPITRRNLQVQPYGRFWIYQALCDDESRVASYLWEVVPGRVVGRRTRLADDIMKLMEKSKISSLGAKEAIFKIERNRLLESAGFDADEADGGV